MCLYLPPPGSGRVGVLFYVGLPAEFPVAKIQAKKLYKKIFFNICSSRKPNDNWFLFSKLRATPCCTLRNSVVKNKEYNQEHGFFL